MNKITLETKMKDVLPLKESAHNLVIVKSLNCPRLLTAYEAKIFSLRNLFKEKYKENHLKIMASLATGDMMVYDFVDIDEEILLLIFGEDVSYIYELLAEFYEERRMFDQAQTILSDYESEKNNLTLFNKNQEDFRKSS